MTTETSVIGLKGGSVGMDTKEDVEFVVVI